MTFQYARYFDLSVPCSQVSLTSQFLKDSVNFDTTLLQSNNYPNIDAFIPNSMPTDFNNHLSLSSIPVSQNWAENFMNSQSLINPLNCDFVKGFSQYCANLFKFDINLNNSSKFGFNLNLKGSYASQLTNIKKIFNQNRAKYDAVAKATGVPAELICAIHFRESGCKFDTYLHNGDPLGKPTVHVPKGKFFTDWTEAAIDAIKSNSYYKNVKANDINSQLEFAERYNGLGYRNKGLVSPYVWAGTDKYTQGKYVADGKYSSTTVDKQVGVAPILDTLRA